MGTEIKHNYFKGNSKLGIKIAIAVKGFTGAIGITAIASDHKWIGIATLVIGALANEVVNFLSDGTQQTQVENQDNKTVN